ncbi:MAG TPA: PEP-CTERM sorting domain-containing protein [Terriglobales bacterium]|nr:PEP-CTERM sorting domain-containing protein [Terriglobales bacterium]
MLVLIALLAAATTAFADILPGDDPAVLHMGPGVGTSCATGGCYMYSPSGSGNPTEVNPITRNVDIYMNSGGAGPQASPILLILAVPNDTTKAMFDATSIASVDLYHNSTTPTNSLTWNYGDPNNTYNLTSGKSGYQGSFTATAFKDKWNVSHPYNGQADVYKVLNLTGNGSNNFVNWAGADLQVNNISVTNFAIYVFAINLPSGATFDSKDYINVKFVNDVPVGTFVVAYSQNPNATSAGDVYTTPFTESGLSTRRRIPEPASALLFGLGLVGFAALRRRL